MKKVSITTIGLIAMLMLMAAPIYAGDAYDMEQGGEKAILASSLMDREVQGAQGEKIGTVSDIMIGSDGNVEYIVLSEGASFLGFGETDLVPVPWSKVNTGDIGEDQEIVTLSLSNQELENAPAFNEEEWQAFLGGEKQQEVRGYYGTEDEDARPWEQEQMMEKKETEGRSGDSKY